MGYVQDLNDHATLYEQGSGKALPQQLCRGVHTSCVIKRPEQEDDEAREENRANLLIPQKSGQRPGRQARDQQSHPAGARRWDGMDLV